MSLAGTLAAGLPEDSRCKRGVKGELASQESILLAAILDRLNLWIWLNQDERKRGPEPERLVEKLFAANQKKGERDSNIVTFSTAEEFEAAKARIQQGGE